jgi:hypothetical protein
VRLHLCVRCCGWSTSSRQGVRRMKLIITKLDNGYTLSVQAIMTHENGLEPIEIKQRFAFETKDALNRKLTELLA